MGLSPAPGQPGGLPPSGYGPGGGGGPPPGFGGGNDLAVAALICGIVSLASNLCCCIPIVNWFAWLIIGGTGIAAIVCGILGYQRSQLMNGAGKNEAIAGIVLGSVVFVLGIVGIVIAIAVLGVAGIAGAAH